VAESILSSATAFNSLLRSKRDECLRDVQKGKQDSMSGFDQLRDALTKMEMSVLKDLDKAPDFEEVGNECI